MSNIRSPCIRHCTLNDNDICIGCLRNVEEILRWAGASVSDKQQILERIKKERAVTKP